MQTDPSMAVGPSSSLASTGSAPGAGSGTRSTTAVAAGATKPLQERQGGAYDAMWNATRSWNPSGYVFARENPRRLPGKASSGASPAGSFKHHSAAYRLEILQQPKHARLCSFREGIDRRPVDPPPIVRVSNDDTEPLGINSRLCMKLDLVHDRDGCDVGLLKGQSVATGTIIQNPYQLRDLDNQSMVCFVFTDISIRQEGNFRFKFTLYEIVADGLCSLASAETAALAVVSPKTFPGMAESTALTRHLVEQGLRAKVRQRPRINAKTREIRSQALETGAPGVRASKPSESDPGSHAPNKPDTAPVRTPLDGMPSNKRSKRDVSLPTGTQTPTAQPSELPGAHSQSQSEQAGPASRTQSWTGQDDGRPRQEEGRLSGPISQHRRPASDARSASHGSAANSSPHPIFVHPPHPAERSQRRPQAPPGRSPTIPSHRNDSARGYEDSPTRSPRTLQFAAPTESFQSYHSDPGNLLEPSGRSDSRSVHGPTVTFRNVEKVHGDYQSYGQSSNVAGAPTVSGAAGWSGSPYLGHHHHQQEEQQSHHSSVVTTNQNPVTTSGHLSPNPVVGIAQTWQLEDYYSLQDHLPPPNRAQDNRRQHYAAGNSQWSNNNGKPDQLQR